MTPAVGIRPAPPAPAPRPPSLPEAMREACEEFAALAEGRATLPEMLPDVIRRGLATYERA